MFISFDTFYTSMDFTEEEGNHWQSILSHAIWGLNKEEWLTNFSWENEEHVRTTFS